MNSDIKKVKENSSVSTVSDVIIDGIGFIPNGGAIASYGLSEIKEAGEQVYQHEKEYQKQEIIEKFSNQKNTDLEHNIEKSVRQDI